MVLRLVRSDNFPQLPLDIYEAIKNQLSFFQSDDFHAYTDHKVVVWQSKLFSFFNLLTLQKVLIINCFKIT